jgi:hypothetical protein
MVAILVHSRNPRATSILIKALEDSKWFIPSKEKILVIYGT